MSLGVRQDVLPPPPLAVDTAAGRATRGGILRGLAGSMRPRQWTKNVFVLAAPASAGLLGHGTVLGRVALAIVAFCLLSGGGYLINDALDAPRDRRHPRKRARPVAAGTVPVRLAFTVGGALIPAGLAVAALAGWGVLGICGAYAGLIVAYSTWLKHEPVVEMAILAGAFVLRAAAGGAAAGVHLSSWFVVVVSSGALLIVAGKRYAEHVALGGPGAGTRRVLDRYTPAFLRFVWGMSATVAVMGYCLWALLPSASPEIDSPWPGLSAVPFVIGIMRYGLLLETGAGEAPEEVFLRDRVLQVCGVLWVGIYLTGLYAF